MELGTFIIALCSTTGGSVWVLSNSIRKVRQEVSEVVDTVKHEINGDLTLLRKDLGDHRLATDSDLSNIRGEFGETVKAMREQVSLVQMKVHEVEIWGRDHYVQVGAIDRFESQVKELGTDLKAAMGRLESRLDKAQGLVK